jgi:hypothetical protein
MASQSLRASPVYLRCSPHRGTQYPHLSLGGRVCSNHGDKMTQDGLWLESYRAAMLELDPIKLVKRIEAARTAIERRNEELPGSNRNGSAVEERQVITDALENLRALQRVDFRSWSKPHR